jgi:uncharacterized membrane protein YeaQ/YmgE (transglycosylase-associated protein family)
VLGLLERCLGNHRAIIEAFTPSSGRGKPESMVTLLVILLVLIVMIALGVAVVGLVLELLWWALVGLVIGGLARLFVRGTQPIGWLGTIAAGIAGALLGGVIGDALGGNGLLELVLAVALAALLIAAFGGTRRAYA